MNPESFDRAFRNRLYHAESPVSDHIWDEISARIPSAKKKDRWLLIFFICLASLGTVLTTTYFLSDSGTSGEMITLPSNQRQGVPISEKVQKKPAGKTPNHNLKQSIIHPNIKAVQQDVTTGIVDTTNTVSVTALPRTDLETVTTAPIRSKSNLSEVEEIRSPTSLTEVPHKLFKITGFSNPKIDICPAFTTANKGIRPFIEFSVAGGMPLRSLVAVNTEWDSYLQSRLDSESPRISIDLMILGGLHFGRHLEIKAGLGLNQVRETFDFIDEDASRTITHIITDTVISGNMVTITTDTSVVTEYGQRLKKTNNAYTRIDLPILAGYRFSIHRHKFVVNGGVAINLAFWQKGNILSADGEIVPVDASQFSTNAGLDLLGSIGYVIDLSSRNSLSLMVAYRHSLRLLTNVHYPLEQKYSQINLGVALKQHF